MSKRPPIGNQVDTISRYAPYVQESFDLARQDVFVTSLGVDFKHFKAIPSPIGQNDRGDYRRNDGVDTITSNGFIYRCAGTLTATIVDNNRSQKRTDGGLLDPSQAKMIMPRFYNKNGVDDGARIYMSPGDRVYIADPDADVHVSNYEKINFDFDKDNVPMFPICQLEMPIIDSRNIEYKQGVDFNITSAGDIHWIPTGNNPGIDPDTKKGRVYSVRYLYRAYWYVTALPKEVRITNVTTGGVRAPERMPYHAIIVREYVYHQKNKGDALNQNPKDPQRQGAEVPDEIDPNGTFVPVEMSDIDGND